jgi:hypothetical protein
MTATNQADRGIMQGRPMGMAFQNTVFCQENLPFLCFINKNEKGIPREEKTRKDTKNNTKIDVTSDLIFSTLLFLDLC